MAQKPELDRVDRALLQALSTNARASGAALAAEVGVDDWPAACTRAITSAACSRDSASSMPRAR